MSKKISHFGVHNAETGQPIAVNANAGDTLLFQATRDLFDRFLGSIEWKLEALWKEVDDDQVKFLNEKSDALLIGGGGLFLRDQAGADASRSGWQWNCPPEKINELKNPLIVFGVGYNRFRNQTDFDDVFSKHITTLVEKSAFFALRNHGSRYAIRRYLPTSLHHRVQYQPCPTTLAWYLYPELMGTLVPQTGSKVLALNAAFDRREMRFAHREGNILAEIATVMKKCVEDGWKIVLANHKPQDAEIGKFLDDLGVAYEAVDLSQAYPKDILAFYADKDLTVGMRGHAQMIPFGMRKPIVSIISHDKMGWFLDDIRHPEWGVDVEDPLFKERLYSTINDIGNDDKITDKLARAQEWLWQVTSQNMATIKKLLS